MKSTDVTNGVCTHELDSWKEFSDFIRDEHSNCPALIYRGQASSEWKIESTIDRLEQRFPTKPNYINEKAEPFNCPPTSRTTHLDAFKDAVRGKRGSNPPDIDNNDEWWALAQHHGLATPMLDWTCSPFVALFFAFEEEKCDVSSEQWARPEKRIVYALSSSCVSMENSSKPSTPLVFSPMGDTNYRIVNQAGLLLRMPEDTDLESYVCENFIKETTVTAKPPRSAKPILQKIIIPNDDRINCLKFLNKMNINRMSLFPDIDGAGCYINALWELGFDTAMGYLPNILPNP